ncbi:LOW QUALITY PROTEIN: hypothetical protein Dda_7656 [Drechslerella dactyloides]|uniref:C2 domain-containing protein n=1 Tax=Drechslerella dactyloides TaxID=74499 RepID=A0AAD6IT13_DREDA|nr:LOW QUALITY PROTEIN: hypothetical protein Dda_7656 [Drechslerella dactyloides]
MADPIQRRGEKPVSNTLKKPPPKGTDQKHPAGIFADMATDGPLIGTLVVVVDKAKNLPNLKSIGKQDPYCVLRLGKHVKKTDPDKRGGQTPKWFVRISATLTFFCFLLLFTPHGPLAGGLYPAADLSDVSFRDAERRFPVHDSADYRNLKIVIFTDDKKTELIGETVVNLDKILDTSGGGQSDGWHQCKCRGRYAGDIRVELTFWDERPRETAPLVVNTRQITGFEKEDFKRPDKSLAGPRRPGAQPRKRELPDKPTPANPTPPKPAKENIAPTTPSSGPDEEPEPPAANHRKDRERHREREPRERHRSKHREHRREKSRHHARDQDRRSPDEYDNNGAYQQSPSHHAPYEAQDQYGNAYYQQQQLQQQQQQQQNQVATLQEFQSDHIGKLQAQYVEQTQMIPHQRHSPNPAYQNDFYDGQQQQQQQQWQQPQDFNMNAMVLASQNGPPSLPHHRHVEFADPHRSAPALPPPQPTHGLRHRRSRSEFYPNRTPDVYQQGNNPYNNQLMPSNFAPAPPPRHGYDQQYVEQPSYGSMQGFDMQNQFNSMPPQSQPPLQYQQQNGGYQTNYQDQYAEQPYQSQQLARASDFAPPPLPPQHSQAAAYRTTPIPVPVEEYNNSSALILPQAATPAPPPPAHRQAPPRKSLPAGMAMGGMPQMQPLQQKIPTPQPMDMYEPAMQLQSLRGFAPQLPSHGGSQFQRAASPQPPPQRLQPPTAEQMGQIRPRGNSEPPPYAAITDSGAPLYQQPETGYAQPDSYSSQRNFSTNGYGGAPAPAATYTSITDYNQAATPLSQRLTNFSQPQNVEHAFDPTTALILSGGGPPPLPSHSGAAPIDSPAGQRGRNYVPPISTNFSPQKSHSRTPSPHPLSLTPGYGPDSPADGDPFAQQLAAATAEPPAQSNYHAPYVKDVTGRQSLESRRDSAGFSPMVDANRRQSLSPIPPPNTYSQELATTRGAPPPLPPNASHRMSQQQLVYKHDPSERPSEARSNRSSAYDYAGRLSPSPHHMNNHNGIPGAQTSSPNSSGGPPAARDSARQPYIEDEIDETDCSADPTFQSASWSAGADDREYVNNQMPAAPSYKHTPPSSGKQSPYPEYGADGLHMHSPGGGQVAPIIKPRATSPIPGRRSADIPRGGHTPEPDRRRSRSPAVLQPLERKMTTLGGMPFSPDDYDAINPVNNYSSASRSPSGNISTMPLARSPGSIAMSPGQYMTAKEEKKARKEEEKAAKRARKRILLPNSANRELEDDDILAPDTFAPEPERRNSFNASGAEDDDDDDDELEDGVQPLSFRPRRRSVSPQPPPTPSNDVYRRRSVSPQPPLPPADVYGASRRRSVSPQPPLASNDMYGTSPGRGASSGAYGYGAPVTSGHRPLPGAPVMRNAITAPDDYYHQQGHPGPGVAARPMQIPQANPGTMTQEQWSLSQELSSISIGTSSRRRTGTWA